MKSLLLLILVGCVGLCLPEVVRGQQAGEFRSLLDGENLQGWYGNNPHTTAKAPAELRDETIDKQQAEFKKHWRVEKGQLINDGQGPYATTNEEFGDIELWIDYRTVPEADSGIYLRGTPQVQIWDTTQAGGKWDRGAKHGSGGLFNNTKGRPGQLPMQLADRAFGEWNQFRIVQIGSRTWVKLNDKTVVDGAIMENYWDKERLTPLPAKGPIHLQTHGGEIRWKNIQVRNVESAEAIQWLREDENELGFVSLFNGTDLSGWTGKLDDYHIQDGSIVCKPGKGGVLFTECEYENFVVRLEFQLPPGGNNGLAIRYPGIGRAAYDGMCELQVLDNSAEKYADLDARQYHGSVYGMAAAHRGYLRPAGEWNFQEVTVDGSQIRVELNGTIILDCDVSAIQETKDNLAHPGKSLTRGHFGFAGHNDPVKFRNIAIRELPSTPNPTFVAEFDDSLDANVSASDPSIYTAESTQRKNPVAGNQISEVALDNKGKFGKALKFSAKTKDVLFYSGREIGYRKKDWQGTVSFWMKLDPNKDLEPGYCDPIQITQRAWNDAAFFVDFDKELPRSFRLGVFPDLATWNPHGTDLEQIPPAQLPLVTVENPPFGSNRWTHVCFTWKNINASADQPSVATLYLDGKIQGTIERPLRFTWNPDQAAIMLGLNYIGLIDRLTIFESALGAEQIRALASATR